MVYRLINAIRSQLYQIALAIAYLHGVGIIHGDIKGENVLISEKHTALLSDYGLPREQDVLTSIHQKGQWAIPWQSPELLDGQSKSEQSDIYAFGMTIYEVRGALWDRRTPHALTVPSGTQRKETVPLLYRSGAFGRCDCHSSRETAKVPS